MSFGYPYETPYKFNGKEKDEETGYNYYEARYYGSDLSIFLSVDEFSDKYPHLSPYCYVANNPIIYIDPDGRDIYQVDETGNAVGRITNKNFDQFQVVSVDKDGNKTEIASSEEYKYGTVIGRVSNLSTGKKDKEGPINVDFYAIKGSKEGEGIHKFLSNNTNVEFGRWDFESSLGEINVIGTGHRIGSENSAPYMKNYLSRNNWFGFLKAYDHNHPNGNPSPSGQSLEAKSGDVPFIKSIENANPNVDFRIYTKDKGYSYYNSFGPSTPRMIYK